VSLRIAEVCVYGKDLRRMREFYSRLLEVHPVVEEDRHVFFKVGDTMLLIFDPDKTLRSTDVPPHGCRGPSHIAFYTSEEEYGTWKDRLESMGVEIEAEITWPHGGRSLYFRDPEGNSVEITTPKTWAWADGS